MTRRNFTIGAGALVGTGLMGKSADAKVPARNIKTVPKGTIIGLVTSIEQEYDYEPKIEGKIPKGLQGSLYRNGPALFERDGVRKKVAIDGDGMIQAYHFGENKVKYISKFVQTKRYKEEQALGKYKYSSWSLVVGGMLDNLLGANMESNAGVTVWNKNNRLFAFDESTYPYELDEKTLDTLGETKLGVKDKTILYAAHAKTDPRNGDWAHFGLEYGSTQKLHITVFDKNIKLKTHSTIDMPTTLYIHDWFLSANYFIFHLHPNELQSFGFLTGQNSLIESMHFKKDKPSIWMAVPRDGKSKPIFAESEARWMWHSINAYEMGDEIVMDFIGHKTPNHFLGDDSFLRQTMLTDNPINKGYDHGNIMQAKFNIKSKKINLTTTMKGDHEFPMVSEAKTSKEYKYAYYVGRDTGHNFFNSIKKMNLKNETEKSFSFEKGVYVTEPIFAKDPEGKKEDSGWILTLGYDGNTKKSFLAIFNAQNIDSGPLAKIHHHHHIPLTFHGSWKSA